MIPRAAAHRVRVLARRIDAATPAHRDRTVDALRALAITGVILGHWLVTALVPTHGQTGTGLADKSPLAAMPALTPVSWVFQTLAVFFLVGGYAAARSYRGNYLAWLGRRLARLGRPVAVLAAFWAVLATGLYLGGVSGPVLRTVLTLVGDPLWFLGVFAALTALTPLAVALVRRLGAWAAVIPLAVVAGADAVRFGLGGPGPAGSTSWPAGWCRTCSGSRGRGARSAAAPGRPSCSRAAPRRPRRSCCGRAIPASMVGVNGARISNLNPPTLAVVTFGIAQAGLALLLREPLARWMRRPVAWAVVATANLTAMTLFLWHQTAFLAVNAAGLLIGRLPGLATAPSGALWVAERLAWLPVFGAALAVLWLVLRRAERPPRPRPPASGPCSRRPGHPAWGHAGLTRVGSWLVWVLRRGRRAPLDVLEAVMQRLPDGAEAGGNRQVTADGAGRAWRRPGHGTRRDRPGRPGHGTRRGRGRRLPGRWPRW